MNNRKSHAGVEWDFLAFIFQLPVFGDKRLRIFFRMVRIEAANRVKIKNAAASRKRFVAHIQDIV